MIVRAAPPDDDMDGSGHNAAAASRSRARSGSNASADQLQTSRKRSESGGGSGDGGGTREAEGGKDGSAVPVCWFEDEGSGLALRWHLFAGTLYDLNSKRNNPQGRGLDYSSGAGAVLPWKLRVHFTSYPTNQILPFDTNSNSSSSSSGGGDIMPTIQRYYMNSLKQALFLEHGSTQVAMNICKADHRKLWDAVVSSNYHLYGEINAELQADIRERNNSGGGTAGDAEGGSSGGDEGLRNIPVRVLVDSKPAIQRLCPTFCENDGNNSGDESGGKSATASTLGDVLLLFCPNLFERKSRKGAEGAEEGTDDTKEVEGPEEKVIIPTENLTWIVQGIAGLPLSFSIGQIWRTLCSPDHFVYVSVMTR